METGQGISHAQNDGKNQAGGEPDVTKQKSWIFASPKGGKKVNNQAFLLGLQVVSHSVMSRDRTPDLHGNYDHPRAEN